MMFLNFVSKACDKGIHHSSMNDYRRAIKNVKDRI